MFNAWFFLFLLAALIDWYATARAAERARLLTKPLALLLLLAWFTSQAGWLRPAGVWFGLGLVFSLLGDVLLLKRLAEDRPLFFLLGMGAFLAAHLAYIAGFLGAGGAPQPAALLLLVLVGAANLVIGRTILRGVRSARESRPMAPALATYMLVISLMLAAAWSTLFQPAWTPAPALLAALGASLFALSDALIAYDRFVRPVPASDILVMVSYHLAQLGIVAGFLTSGL